LVTTLKNYHPLDYYEELLDLFSHCASREMLKRRMEFAPSWQIKVLHWVRTVYTRSILIKGYPRIMNLLRSDPHFLSFHEGRSTDLPHFYHSEYERMLGRYAELLSRADRTPVLEQAHPSVRETTANSRYCPVDLPVTVTNS
jgi:hypothetical protein